MDREKDIIELAICKEDPPKYRGCQYYDSCKIDYGKLRRDNVSVELKRCPVCNHELTLTKETFSAGMDGGYQDWVVECTNCCLLRFEISADSFYGGEYAKTRDEAVEKFNDYISKFAINER